MLQILQTFAIAILYISHISIAVYSNLLYDRPSTVYPSLYAYCSGTFSNVYATDRVMTRYYADSCSWVGYLFGTGSSINCSLTIYLPSGTKVKSVLISLPD